MDLIALHRQWKDNPSRFLEKEITTQLDCLIYSIIKTEGYVSFIRPQEEYLDIIQDLRLLCWDRWITVSTDPEESFISYFAATIRGFLKTKFRRTKQKVERGVLVNSHFESSSIIDNPEEGMADKLSIELYLNKLSAIDKIILKKSLEGCSVREISRSVPMSKTSVHERLSILKNNFRERVNI